MSQDIIWISRAQGRPFPIQQGCLLGAYRDARIVQREIWNAEKIVDTIARERPVDWVLLAPESVVSAVLALVRKTSGVAFPLRPVIEVTQNGRYDVQFNGRQYVFYGFQRILRCEFIEEDPTSESSVRRILPILDHDLTSNEIRALRDIFPHAELLQNLVGRRGSGAECVHRILSKDAQACVFVGPYTLYEAVVGAGVYTLRGEMDGDRFVRFRHVVGIRREMPLVIPYTRAVPQ